MSLISSVVCAGSDLQFLNAILSLETLAIIDLFLAMQIVFRGRSTLSTVLTFLSNPGMQLNGPRWSAYRPERYRRQRYTHVFGLFLLLFSFLLGGFRGLLSYWLLLRFWFLSRSIGVDGGEERRYE
jgi:hypothetical protein